MHFPGISYRNVIVRAGLAALLWSGRGATVASSSVDVDALTSMATQQAVPTWKPIKVTHGLYTVRVRPISKTLFPACAFVHHGIRKQGKMVRDHTVKICGEGTP
jgi:hypothetical protein